jgi:ribosomal-protein-alanine N-acetyltransferase
MVTIRAACAQDIELLAQLHGRVCDEAWSAADFSHFVADAQVVCRVAVVESGGIVGCVVLRIVLDEAEVITLGVDVPMRGKGIAHLLLNHALHVAASLQVQQCFLEVREDNVAAITLYQRVRFRQVGVRKDYYVTPQGRKDAWMMVLILADFKEI